MAIGAEGTRYAQPGITRSIPSDTFARISRSAVDMSAPPLFGLVLAGGASTRMGRDKAALAYHGRSQLEWTFDLASEVCAATFVSVRPDQRDEPTRKTFPQVVDLQPGIGPIAGISAAL